MEYAQNVVKYIVDAEQTVRSSILMLEDEIPEGKVFYHCLPEGAVLHLPAESNVFKTVFLIEGNVKFLANERVFKACERATFVPSPEMPAVIEANVQSRLLEVQKSMTHEDVKEYIGYGNQYPYFRIYEESVQYADRNTSEKTIKREIVKQRIIPRFAMGSCESYGYDTMGVSSHPHLDQMFFSLPGCDIQVLIDDGQLRLTQNILMHIPLGARHGVIVPEGNYMHYIWIDFMASSSGAEQLDKGHIPTGKHRSF